MNRKVFWLVSVFVFSSMLILGSRYVQAQIAGFIPVFVDEFGTEDNSVIFQTPAGNVGIGTTTPSPQLTLTLGGARRFGFVQDPGDQGDAGRLDYKNFDPRALSIVGAGRAGGSRKIRLFDSVSIGGLPPGDGGTALVVAGNVSIFGGFTATGPKAALVETISYGKRQLYAVESPENWFEDFGKAKLTNGQTVVKLEPIFVETVNTENDYHVFLTPQGNCEGLYVANKTAASFEVRELRKGKSTIAFDYRVVAKRKGYEQTRLAEVKDTRETKTPEKKLADARK